MGIPDPAQESYLINAAETRASELIAAFSANQSADSRETFARVSSVLDEYCGVLLEELRRGVGTIDASDAAWLRKHYLRLIVEFATTVRDSIADQASRHAAAQVIQCKVLEHERNLRIVLDGDGGSVPSPTEPAAVKVSANS
jgi:hypothetical protein